MSQTASLARPEKADSVTADRSKAGLRYDWAYVALSFWMVGGLHLDAWAHHQQDLETFFTPWHAVLYSGFLALAGLLAGTFIRSLRAGLAWQKAVPAGYELSLLGAVLFAAGGLGDALWHSIFGIEVDIEALLSPTHLVLALGGGLIVSGPFRAGWARKESKPRLAALLPGLFSLSLILSILAFFTSFANPLANPEIARGVRPIIREQALLSQALGVAGILLHTGLMMGLILLAVRRWALPFGSLTFVLALSSGLAISIHEDFELLPFAVLSGILADLLYLRLPLLVKWPVAFRLFALSTPAIFFALYFVTLGFTGGVWWTMPMWAGGIVLAAVAGWLVSYLLLPPPKPGGLEAQAAL